MNIDKHVEQMYNHARYEVEVAGSYGGFQHYGKYETKADAIMYAENIHKKAGIVRVIIKEVKTAWDSIAEMETLDVTTRESANASD